MRDFRNTLVKEQEELLKKEPHSGLFPNLDASSLRAKFHYRSYPALSVPYQERLTWLIRMKEISETLLSIDRNLNGQNIDIYFESAPVDSEMSDGLITKIVTSENVTDVTGAEENKRSAGHTVNSQQGQKEVLSIQDFFRRPVKIVAGNIALDTNYLTEYQVWDLYTLNPSVRAKLRNYAYLRGDLYLRIELTGTPFNYGKMMVSYQPFPLRNDALASVLFNYGIGLSGSKDCTLNYFSQAPGAVVMDARENKPVELLCPFISTKPMHRLFNTAATVISDVTSYNDLDDCGSLYITNLALFQNVQSETTPIRIKIYAWMENVELGAITGTQITITTESADVPNIYFESDERDIGPLEKISSAAVSISKALSAIPSIRPFALASQFTFGALEKVSAIFGWSKPVYIDAPHYMKNCAFQNGCQTIGYDTSYRMTLDPKQELHVDPRIAGSSNDELTIAHISSVNSYFTRFSWDDATAADALLFKCAVTPFLFTKSKGTAEDILQPTAMNFAVQPFDSWRGDIEYTVMIAASQFHRGKLAIVYEPNINQHTLIPLGAMNKQFIKIIDIQETQTFSFCVNWAGIRPWLMVGAASLNSNLPYTGGPTTMTLNSETCYNGYFSIYVFNQLTNPGTAPIDILMFARCKNLMVNRFNNFRFPLKRSKVLSSAVFESMDMDLSSQPVTCLDLNESTAGTSTICLDYFGERPVSFRSLLKRFVTIETLAATPGVLANGTIVYGVAPIMPPIYAPYYTTGSSTSSPSLYSYLRYAYLGVRGGVRNRLRLLSSVSDIRHSLTRVSLVQENNSTSTSAIIAANGTTANVVQYSVANANGSVLFDRDSGAGVEVELPFYSRNLFSFSYATNLVGTNPGVDSNMDGIWTKSYEYSYYLPPSTATDQLFAQVDFATGEDFNFMRFSGAPNYTL
jgi:hypothetical protein